MGMNQGPAYFTRSRSSPVRRPRSYSRSPEKLLKEEDHTPNHHLGHLLGVLVLDHVPDQGLLITSEVGLDLHPTADPPQGMKHIFQHEKGKFHKSWGIRNFFLKNVVSHLRGIPDLNKFFEGYGIPQYVWTNAQEDSKIEPAEIAEYSAIEQAVSIWWLSNNKPLYWKIEQLQVGFENLKIGKFFKAMLERHPQMNPSFHDIQFGLPENGQAAPSSGPPTPCNITVEYAEKQISKRERNFLKFLSALIYKSEFVDRISVATSLDAVALLTIQAIYHDPKRAAWTTQEYIAYHILVT